MIFVTLGSQKFQFDRLLKAVDKVVEKHILDDVVFAQTGYSDYEPQNYKFKRFLDRNEFAEMEEKADIVITHGGTGAIIGAVKKGKKVIAVPRLAKYGEHVDDHQLQLVRQFKELDLIYECDDCNRLGDALVNIKKMQFKKYKSNTQTIINNIDKYLNTIMGNVN